MNNLDRIESAYRTFRRGGNFLQDVFKKEDKKLTPEECLKLKNTYGIRMEDVVKMAISHDFYINKESLVKIMDEDDSHWKTVRPLAK